MLGGQGYTTDKMFSLLVAWTDDPMGCSRQGKACCKPENWNTLVPVRESHDCKTLLLLNMWSCHQINLTPSALDPAISVVFPALWQSPPLQQGSFLELWWCPKLRLRALFLPELSYYPFLSPVWWGPASFLLQLPPLCSQYQNSKIPPLPPTRTLNNFNRFFPWVLSLCPWAVFLFLFLSPIIF